MGQKPPFVPGYAIVGEVDAIAEGETDAAIGDRVGALTVIGGYAEYVYWRSDRLIPIPESVDAGEAVTIILNYLVAYQMMHRSARVKAGDKALVIGASGGIGTALLQLGALAGLTIYGVASGCKHATLQEMGAISVDYHTEDYVAVVRDAEPDGLHAVFDGMNRLDYVRGGLSLLRQGGTLVSYGEPAGLGVLARILSTLVAVKLLPNGKTFKLYGTSSYVVFDQYPFIEDWVVLFRLLVAGKIKPVITRRFPILAAADANALLESGEVIGNVVLVAPELL